MDDHPSLRVLPKTRRLVRKLTPEQQAERQKEMPPIEVQMGNALKAAGRLAVAVVKRQKIQREPKDQDRVLSICRTCEWWEPTKERCGKCGCFGVFKSWLATEQCPDGKW